MSGVPHDIDSRIRAQSQSLRRVDLFDSVPLPESRARDGRGHLACRVCGRTDDVRGAVLAPGLTSDMTAGYAVEGAEVTFWGRCPGCTDPSARPPPGHRP